MTELEELAEMMKARKEEILNKQPMAVNAQDDLVLRAFNAQLDEAIDCFVKGYIEAFQKLRARLGTTCLSIYESNKLSKQMRAELLDQYAK